MLKDIVCGEGPTGIEHEQAKELALFHGEADGVFRRELQSVRIELEAGKFQLIPGIPGPAPCHGIYAGQKLLHSKGLGQIVIGAGLKASNAVINLHLGREHDHGRDDSPL